MSDTATTTKGRKSTKADDPTNTITVPAPPDPSILLDQQIAEAKSVMDSLFPAVEAFRAWEQFVNSLLEVKEGKNRRANGTPAKRRSNGQRGRTAHRAQEFLAVVKAAGDEGVTVADAAKAMDMGPNYLYRLAPEMVDAGNISKQDKRYVFVKDMDATTTEDNGGSEGTEATSDE